MKPWDMSIRIRANVANADRNPLSAQEQLEMAEYLDCLSRIHVEMKGYDDFEFPNSYTEACECITDHLTAAGIPPEPADEEEE